MMKFVFAYTVGYAISFILCLLYPGSAMQASEAVWIGCMIGGSHLNGCLLASGVWLAEVADQIARRTASMPGFEG